MAKPKVSTLHAVVGRTTTRSVACSVPRCDERGDTDLVGDLYLCPTHLEAWRFVTWCLERCTLLAEED